MVSEATPGIARAGSGASRLLRIAMVTYADLTHDSRVQREAHSLAQAGHQVTIYCLAAQERRLPGIDERVRVVVVPPRPGGVIPGSPSPFRGTASGRRRAGAGRLGWLVGYARTLRAWGTDVGAIAGDVDVWHANDFTGLVAVAGRVGRSRLVYDVHDLFLESGIGARLPRQARWLLGRYEGRLVRRADAVVTVNQALADVLRGRYGPRSIAVVHNCPPRWSPPDPPLDRIRTAAGIPSGAPVVLYHGLPGPQRGLPQVLDALGREGMDRAHLAILGIGVADPAFTERLDGDERLAGRVHLLPAVPPSELLDWVSGADVGVMVYQPVDLNHRLSTPNKLFESLAAGVPVVSSDFPERRRIIIDDPDGPLGAVCDPTDPAAVAAAIASIISLKAARQADLRTRCLRAAHSRWNWENEAGHLVRLYERLATGSDAPQARAG